MELFKWNPETVLLLLLRVKAQVVTDGLYLKHKLINLECAPQTGRRRQNFIVLPRLNSDNCGRKYEKMFPAQAQVVKTKVKRQRRSLLQLYFSFKAPSFTVFVYFHECRPGGDSKRTLSPGQGEDAAAALFHSNAIFSSSWA